MRLPLSASVFSGCLLCLSGCAGSGMTHTASARLHVYADPRLTVVSPAIRDEAEWDDGRVAASYTADVVSGATQALPVDAISSATEFSEMRHQAAASGAYALTPETEIGAAYTFGIEPDHMVHAPAVAIATELFDGMTRASARYTLALESIGRAGDPVFEASASGHRVDLAVVQIATDTVVLSFLASGSLFVCSAELGCFANPYRYVRTAAPGGRIALPERHPTERGISAAAVRLAWALDDETALHAGYRFSIDSWAITAQTIDLAIAAELLSKLLARVDASSTLQTGASFYRASDEYTGTPAYRTADAELSPLTSVRVVLHLEWDAGFVRLTGELGRMWNFTPSFEALPERHAWIGGAGLDADL
jgi:hypothetical protein